MLTPGNAFKKRTILFIQRLYVFFSMCKISFSGGVEFSSSAVRNFVSTENQVLFSLILEYIRPIYDLGEHIK